MADDLAALRRRQKLAATAASEKAMDLVLGAAAQLAPHEEGTLAGTADQETRVRGDLVEIVGSFSTPYAARQHEELSYTHKAGKQAKYLEEPFKRLASRYQLIVGAAVRRVT